MNNRLPTVALALCAFVPFAACSPDSGSTSGATVPRAALDAIDMEALRGHVEWLADDEREGRRAGTEGYDDSARYVGNFLLNLGLEPTKEGGWYEPVPLITYQIDVDNNSLVVHRDGGDVEYAFGEHYSMGGDEVRPEVSVRAEVVYVGFGVHAPEHGYSDYDGVDVDGKIVALFRDAPSMIEDTERAYYASGRTKAGEAVKRGAVGMLYLRSELDEQRYPWERVRRTAGKQPSMTWVSLTGEAADYYEQIRGAALLSPDVAAEMMASSPITFEQAREAIASNTPSSVPLGFEVSMARNTTHDRILSPNVIGMIRGTDPELADEYVLYSAHLDGVGIEVAPEGDDNIRNGAYDNAMGVAIMLETARAMVKHPPRRSVLFVALTAEELGLLGSDYLAHYPPVPTDSIVANINLDMPLFLYPVADLVAFGAEHSSIGPVVDRAAEAEGFYQTPNPLPEENLFIRSDQYSFVRKGIPAIYLIPGFTSTDPDVDGEALFRDHLRNHYHKVSDDLSRPVDWDSVERFTRSHVRIGYEIANADERPTWNEGNFFGERFGR